MLGRRFLVDASTKWIDIHITNSATSLVIIKKMQTTFTLLGLPEVLVTDNGTAFTSAEFEHFCKLKGIRHIASSPYHPATNGLAEEADQTFKEGIKKLTDGSLETRLARLLFKYRLTPLSVTGVSPAELLMGRPLRSQLDLLHPDIESRYIPVKSSRRNLTVTRRNVDSKRVIGSLLAASVQDQCGFLVWLPRSVVRLLFCEAGDWYHCVTSCWLPSEVYIFSG